MFFKQELGWNATKVDELLSPVIQKMNRRRTNASGTASGVQGSLSDWVSVHAGNNMVTGNLAPRKKEVYTSRRLQEVVADFRKRRKAGSVGQSHSGSGFDQGDNGEESVEEPAKKRRRKPTSSAHQVKIGRRRSKEEALGTTTKGERKRKDYQESRDEDERGNSEVRVPAATAAMRSRLRSHPHRIPKGSSAAHSEIDSE